LYARVAATTKGDDEDGVVFRDAESRRQVKAGRDDP